MTADIEKVKEEVRNILLDEILNEIPALLDETCEVCVPMILEAARKKGLVVLGSKSQQLILDKLVESGKMTRREAIWRGRRVFAYRKSVQDN